MSSSVTVDDRVWRKLVAKIGKDLAKKGVRVGVLASKGAGNSHDSHKPNKPGKGAEISMIELAAIHEFGSPAAGIEARSFIREPLEKSEHAQRIMMGKIAKAIIENRQTVDNGLEILGLWGVSTIKKAIVTGLSPGNDASTIAAKGSSKPLVDTGRLLNAINHEVE